MATELWSPSDDGLFIRGFEHAGATAQSDLCIWRMQVCPVCHREFVIFYKEQDGTDLHHETLHCPRGVGGQELRSDGPPCGGRIGAELPATYLLLPAVEA